jgi:DNA (cytosine-5)-methyltransferase 1
MGYHRAGFDVVGVDIEPQPHYPFEFHQGDALLALRGGLWQGWVDAIHASPPCQQFTVYRNARPGHEPRWPDLIAPTRDLLEITDLPWVMENVQGAPMDPGDTLFGGHGAVICGTALGIPIRRHRLFESSFPLESTGCAHARFTERRFPGSSNRPNGRTVCNVGEFRVPLKVQKECMEVDWDVTLHELSEMIPPKYTEFIGHQLLRHLAKSDAKS